MTMNVKQGLSIASNRYNTLVNEAAHRISHADTTPRRLLADPGKIWAMTNTAGDRYKAYHTPEGRLTCKRDPAGERATPNYGWHRTPGNVRDVIQTVGSCHGAGHIDYSQVFVVVAGWCEVTRPGGAPTWERTAEVYQSDALHPLVSYEGKLRMVTYDWL
jgi:hypothetical protein